MARTGMGSGVPQIGSIVKPTRAGVVNLKKRLREHMGDDGGPLTLSHDGEWALSTTPGEGAAPVERRGNRITLSDEVLAALGWAEGDLLALVQRAGMGADERARSVAIKRFVVIACEGAAAALVDREDDVSVTRSFITHPEPEAWLGMLREGAADRRLRHDPRATLAERPTLDAWRSRRVAGWPDPDDDALAQRLAAERIDAQEADGSWADEVVLTARHLLELHDLGVAPHDPSIERGVAWLLARPASPWNPGMFFGADSLVARQIEVVAARERGERARFRERRALEMRITRAGDELFAQPCGPRIMWPNAFAVEALIATGHETHPRVRTALNTLGRGEWCECGYQHGASEWRRPEPPSLAVAEAFERACIEGFRYGGIRDLDDLATMDLCKTTGERLYRVSSDAHLETPGTPRAYRLEMPLHLQGCEMLTTRALANVTDERLRALCRAYLWRFAAAQNGPGGTFGGSSLRHYFHDGQLGVLSVFCRYDHPAARLAIMRLLPWIVDRQNPDGSWGADGFVERGTSVVLQSLSRVRDLLPDAFLLGM